VGGRRLNIVKQDDALALLLELPEDGALDNARIVRAIVVGIDIDRKRCNSPLSRCASVGIESPDSDTLVAMKPALVSTTRDLQPLPLSA
jgi:hypothetical protein